MTVRPLEVLRRKVSVKMGPLLHELPPGVMVAVTTREVMEGWAVVEVEMEDIEADKDKDIVFAQVGLLGVIEEMLSNDAHLSGLYELVQSELKTWTRENRSKYLYRKRQQF